MARGSGTTVATLCGLLACGAETGKERPGDRPADVADADADTDADADADTDTDPPDPDWFEPAVVLLSAWFGYDADAGTLVEVVSPYGTVDSRIRLEVGSAEWEDAGFDGYRTELYCVVELPLTDGTPPAWAVAEPSIWYGVGYTGAPVDTDCDAAHGYDVDPADFQGYADLAGALSAALPWGIGVGDFGDDPDVQDWLSAYPYAVVPPGTLAGGWVQDGLLGELKDDAFVVANPIDALGLVDHTRYLSSSEMHPGGVGLASGFYRIYFLYHVIL